MNDKDHDNDKLKDKDKDKVKHDSVPEINKASLGASITEAWTDAKCVDKETKMNFPSEEAVKTAKEWVEENEK